MWLVKRSPSRLSQRPMARDRTSLETASAISIARSRQTRLWSPSVDDDVDDQLADPQHRDRDQRVDKAEGDRPEGESGAGFPDHAEQRRDVANARSRSRHPCGVSVLGGEGALIQSSEIECRAGTLEKNCILKTQMPTLRVGICVAPFYRGDVWENQILRIRNRQNLYVFEVYGLGEWKSRKNPRQWKTPIIN